jgi:glycosyltransferase involved in cell wall biosynthesis
LKIALTADPYIPVPPHWYGGIERMIDILVRHYLKKGHQVSLFAHAESVTKAHLFPYATEGNSPTDILKNTLMIWKELRGANYDVLHSFGRMAYMVPVMPQKQLKIMSYQREPTIGQIRRSQCLARKNSLFFTGCSDYISRQISPYALCSTIYNCAEKDKYQFTEQLNANAPLVFLGRIEPIKGVELAIQLAQRTQKRLIIAGNVPRGQEEYFKEQVQPHLGPSIVYVGPVDDDQKNDLLNQALALLFPIQWNEPFGIVMVEAMACGTPVIAFGRGAVPEVVSHGVNGFYADTIEELAGYIEQVGKLSRKTVRTIFENKFSGEVIGDEYLALYKRLSYTRNQ